jgi:hypothetical protein
MPLIRLWPPLLSRRRCELYLPLNLNKQCLYVCKSVAQNSRDTFSALHYAACGPQGQRDRSLTSPSPAVGPSRPIPGIAYPSPSTSRRRNLLTLMTLLTHIFCAGRERSSDRLLNRPQRRESWRAHLTLWRRHSLPIHPALEQPSANIRRGRHVR